MHFPFLTSINLLGFSQLNKVQGTAWDDLSLALPNFLFRGRREYFAD